MKFDEAIKSYFANYANFKGRARRSEYWYAFLFLVLVVFAAIILDSVIFGTSIDSFGIFYAIAVLALFIPNLAITWRRLHDTGRSGAMYFIGLIPIVGGILLLVWLTSDSQSGPNKFGAPVK